MVRRAFLVALALAALYLRFLRRPILTWGATAAEAAARLPGDELLEEAGGVATRAIDIDAPPGAVWPWIVLPMEPASVVMERKMLRGIKQRAERKRILKGARP